MRTGQKRRKREEVYVILLKILSNCLNDVLKYIENAQKLRSCAFLPIYGRDFLSFLKLYMLYFKKANHVKMHVVLRSTSSSALHST